MLLLFHGINVHLHLYLLCLFYSSFPCLPCIQHWITFLFLMRTAFNIGLLVMTLSLGLKICRFWPHSQKAFCPEGNFSSQGAHRANPTHIPLTVFTWGRLPTAVTTPDEIHPSVASCQLLILQPWNVPPHPMDPCFWPIFQFASSPPCYVQCLVKPIQGTLNSGCCISSLKTCWSLLSL